MSSKPQFLFEFLRKEPNIIFMFENGYDYRLRCLFGIPFILYIKQY